MAPHDLIANLEALIAKGGDGAALRLALASRYLDAGDAPAAARHAEAAVRLDPEYSAAWKALGRALTAAGRNAEALGGLRARGQSRGAARRPAGREGNARVQQALAAGCRQADAAEDKSAELTCRAQWWP